MPAAWLRIPKTRLDGAKQRTTWLRHACLARVPITPAAAPLLSRQSRNAPQTLVKNHARAQQPARDPERPRSGILVVQPPLKQPHNDAQHRRAQLDLVSRLAAKDAQPLRLGKRGLALLLLLLMAPVLPSGVLRVPVCCGA